MLDNLKIVLFCAVLSVSITPTSGQCSEPLPPEHAYTLTVSQVSYTSGEIYEFLCIPGYKLDGSGNLTCSGTSWTPGLPSCISAEILKWWVYLVCVVVAIILVPCILPRIYACICKKKSKSDDRKPLTKDKGGYHGKGGEPPGVWRKNKPLTPVTDRGKHKLSSLQNNYAGYPHSKNTYY
ncbi:uncharacterized protein LOC134686524 [Mytilus trossulus]|uniref:uncharacterized protein LOC134686524 n=1 Tax=Mytilus trossulus TaxID=6551 RepID=UPI003007A925